MRTREKALDEMRRRPLVPKAIAARAAVIAPRTLQQSILRGEVEVVSMGRREMVVCRPFLRKIGEG